MRSPHSAAADRTCTCKVRVLVSFRGLYGLYTYTTDDCIVNIVLKILP